LKREKGDGGRGGRGEEEGKKKTRVSKRYHNYPKPSDVA